MNAAEHKAAAAYAAGLESEPEARRLMEVLLRGADLPGRGWPLSTADVLAVAEETGYAIDRDRLDRILALGRIPQPDPGPRGPVWSARSALALFGLLEGLRMWKWGHRRHEGKWSEFERHEQLARAEGRVDVLLDGLAGLTVRELLLLMVAADDQAARMKLMVSARLLLESRGVDPYE